MYRVWYWAIVDRESDGRFLASIPDLGDLAAYGENEKDAVADVTDLAAEHVRALVEGGQAAPRARHASEMPSTLRAKELGRAMIPVQVERAAAQGRHPVLPIEPLSSTRATPLPAIARPFARTPPQTMPRHNRAEALQI